MSDATRNHEPARSGYTGLFASDLAQEIRAEFFDRTEFGVPVRDATAHVLARFAKLLDDPNDGPVVIVSLAALQLDCGQLFESIRDAAIELIESREAQRAWKCLDHELGANRRAVLERLAAALRGAQVVAEDQDD
jgi:hypothetical protein